MQVDELFASGQLGVSEKILVIAIELGRVALLNAFLTYSQEAFIDRQTMCVAGIMHGDDYGLLLYATFLTHDLHALRTHALLHASTLMFLAAMLAI